jgi:4-oxalmesaconate hydratase
MAHHIGDFAISSTWASISNELCYRVSKIFPNNFIGAAMLPQSPGVDPTTCIPELERCVKEYGFVGINLNPDPSGGWWTSLRSLTIYEKKIEYDIPAMVHVSTSCNPRLRRSSPVQRSDKKYRHFAATQYAPSVPSSPRRVWIHLT